MTPAPSLAVAAGLVATSGLAAAAGLWSVSPHAVRPGVAGTRATGAGGRSRYRGRPGRVAHKALLAGMAGMAAGLALHPLLVPVPVAAALAGPRVRARRAARRHEAAVTDQVPDVVDLLRLTTLAGLPVGAAVTAVTDRPGGPVGLGLHRASRRLERGATTATALTALTATCGRPVRPLVDALVDHDRYGTPLGPALDRVGIESRLRRRRQAEEAARRLPVTLLFPLVFTTLPACGLLTVVPLLVASLSSLRP